MFPVVVPPSILPTKILLSFSVTVLLLPTIAIPALEGLFLLSIVPLLTNVEFVSICTVANVDVL